MAVRTERSSEIDVESQLTSAVDRIARGADHLDVMDGDTPVAVVVPVEIYQRFRRMDEANRQALHEAFTKISQAFADVPDDELERELEKARVEYRAEKRTERDALAAG